MTSSRSLHGALTEDVRKTMSGKGREGNKEGKGVRVETSTSILTFRSSTTSDTSQRPTAATSWVGLRREVGAA